MNTIPFQHIDWSTVEKVAYPGESGIAYWQTMQYDRLRIRLVTYSADYKADHWCVKGHIVYCLEGEFVSELQNREPIQLSEGMMYVVSDDMSSHRSVSKNGVKLLIVDGDFLKNSP
jgi:hypothetical protein